MKPAATNGRTFRTFLLMSQLQAQEIGARIKQKRRERGMTQDELAVMTSFSSRSLQDYENGVTIPYRHFQEIGRLLHATPEWLMYGSETGPVRDEEEPDRGTVRGLLRELEATVEAQGASMTLALESLAEGIARLERRLDTASAPAKGRAAR